MLDCVLPVSLDAQDLMSDTALRQITVLKSLAQQYRAQGLRVTLRMTSQDEALFHSEAFQNAVLDLDLHGITVAESAGSAGEQTTLLTSAGKVAAHWNGFAGPAELGLALRKAMGEPLYAQMGAKADE